MTEFVKIHQADLDGVANLLCAISIRLLGDEIADMPWRLTAEGDAALFVDITCAMRALAPNTEPSDDLSSLSILKDRHPPSVGMESLEASALSHIVQDEEFVTRAKKIRQRHKLKFERDVHPQSPQGLREKIEALEVQLAAEVAKNCVALELIAEWQSSAMLVNGVGGDPQGITPEDNERHITALIHLRDTVESSLSFARHGNGAWFRAYPESSSTMELRQSLINAGGHPMACGERRDGDSK